MTVPSFLSTRLQRSLATGLFLLFASGLSAADFAKGADIGWLSQMESSGRKFYSAEGTQTDCIALLKAQGINALRLRVWVNPSSGWCGKADVLAQAQRIKAAGLRLMIDFHYSDTWADPSHQAKPAAWSSHNISQLQTDVATHTSEVLQALKDGGVSPEWIQVGNETNDGMLWNEGRASSSMANFASLITAGCNAAKAIFPDTKVIVHISNGHTNSLFRWIFDGLRTNNAQYDVIGMSLYPEPGTWQLMNEQCLANMKDMVARYGKDVMISEVGMGDAYPASCKAFITDLMAKTKSLPDGHGLGLFYWEPQSYGWQGYRKSAFTAEGKPSLALEAFAAPQSSVAGDRFVNISTRSLVGTDFAKQVAGFVISGTSPRKVLIRAIGPGLIPHGVPEAMVLTDPYMDLYDVKAATIIASNDNWSGEASQANALSEAFAATGAFTLTSGSKDAAMLLTLAPGLYTVEVGGVGSTTGISLIEVYDAE